MTTPDDHREQRGGLRTCDGATCSGAALRRSRRGTPIVVLNTGYVTIGIWMMHRQLLRMEKWRWYLGDTAIPLAGMMAVAWGASLLLPTQLSPAMTLVVTFGVGLVTITVGTGLAHRVRDLLASRLRH